MCHTVNEVLKARTGRSFTKVSLILGLKNGHPHHQTPMISRVGLLGFRRKNGKPVESDALSKLASPNERILNATRTIWKPEVVGFQRLVAYCP